MSVYSLDSQTTYNHYLKYREGLLDLSDKEYANSRFLLGEKIDKKEQIFYTTMLEIFCTDNCELLKFLNDKLQGINTNTCIK